MRVKATKKGQYRGRLIQPGETFVIDDVSHVGTWMEPVNPEDAKRVEAARKAAGQKVAEGSQRLQEALRMERAEKANLHQQLNRANADIDRISRERDEAVGECNDLRTRLQDAEAELEKLREASQAEPADAGKGNSGGKSTGSGSGGSAGGKQSK